MADRNIHKVCACTDPKKVLTPNTGAWCSACGGELPPPGAVFPTSKEVARFDMCNVSTGWDVVHKMVQLASGDYVRWEDYERLARELQAARNRIDDDCQTLNSQCAELGRLRAALEQVMKCQDGNKLLPDWWSVAHAALKPVHPEPGS